MNCHEIQEHLSEYLDHRLEGEKRHEIEEHLASCPDCLPEAKLLSDGIKRVAGLPKIAPPAGFSQRIMAQIRSEAAPPTLWDRLFQPLRIKLPLHATALLLVAGLAVYLYRANDLSRTEMIAPAESSPALKRPAIPPAGETKLTGPPPKEEAPAAAPSEPQRFADSNQPAAERDRIEPQAEENRAPSAPASGLMKSMEDRSNPQSAAGAAVQKKNLSADEASPDATLTFRPHDAAEKSAALTSRMKQAAERSGGKVFALIQDPAEGTPRSDYWLNLPRSEYGRFKTELSQIGQLLSESQPAPAGGRSDPAPSSSMQVRVTVIVENSKGSKPAAPPNPN